MKILVIGGTRYFGIHMVNKLLEQGHEVTIATRGKTPDSYGDKVERITIQRTNEESMREALQGKHFDVVIDKIAYCSNDIRYVMDYVDCDKYIYMSSTSVYNPKHMNTVESDFDGYSKDFVWCDRKEFPYEQIKRQAEYALWQKYPGKKWIAVRYPFAIGKDDYTKRLLFYVEHVIKSEPMYIDNIDYQMSYIRSDEAGEFIAYLVDKDVKGAINGSASETISLREVINYIEEKTGKCAALSEQGEAAPYNGRCRMKENYEYKKATIADIDELVRTRIIVLRAANKLSNDVNMSLVEKESYEYYKSALETGEHIAYLVYDNETFIGAGGVSFYQVMSTYHNPTGKKAYIMNMYMAPAYRRQGIAFHTLDLLVKDAREQGVSQIALEATEMGRPLYEKYGFVKMEDEMELKHSHACSD